MVGHRQKSKAHISITLKTPSNTSINNIDPYQPMKKTLTRTLKIKIDSKTVSALDVAELEQWENEGGRPQTASDFIRSISPLKKGEIFEVVGGDVHYEDGKIYYEAEIEILALP